MRRHRMKEIEILFSSRFTNLNCLLNLCLSTFTFVFFYLCSKINLRKTFYEYINTLILYNIIELITSRASNNYIVEGRMII